IAGPWTWLYEPGLIRERGQLRAMAGAQLDHCAAHVRLCGDWADHQACSNLVVAEPPGHQRQHLSFPHLELVQVPGGKGLALPRRFTLAEKLPYHRDGEQGLIA